MRHLLTVAFALLSSASYAQTCAKLVAPNPAPLSVTGPPGSGYFRYKISEGSIAGGPLIDELAAEFHSSSVGAFNLAAGNNSNYASCDQCIGFSRDYSVAAQFKFFFQSAGVLSISQPPGTNPLQLTFSTVRLVEVTLDPNTFVSTPVPGGECYDLVADQLFRSGFDG